MASAFVMVDVQDATLESLVTGLQSELTTHILEAAVRNALDVPEEKRVMVEPFRNGVVLPVHTTQIVKAALKSALGNAQYIQEMEQTQEALAYVTAALDLIGGEV